VKQQENEVDTSGDLSNGDRLSDFEKGLILGLLIGEGHFGGDGKQPQITLKMHVRHERLLRWVHNRVRWTHLYGPYHHSDRHFMQLMMRGRALRSSIGPTLYSLPWESIDDHSYGRFVEMLRKYGIFEEVVSRSSLS
jgi:hypothetical protein